MMNSKAEDPLTHENIEVWSVSALSAAKDNVKTEDWLGVGNSGYVIGKQDGIVETEEDMRGALSSVAQRLGLYSPAASEASPTFYYYGVYIPPDAASHNDEVSDILHVYMDKSEALKAMKHSKKARFKQFRSRTEAVAFAAHGAEVANTTTSSCASGGSEKVIPFKGPKTQDMIKFRKAIECGDLAAVRKLIWENPRYLVSSGDTPSILQEGSRYNALHVAAKAQNAEMCRVVLDMVGSVDFISRLYDDQDVPACHTRLKVLLDLYLNMPDKGLNETPLHFASKYGAVEVVRLLVSYPECQKNLLNKYQLTAKDMVCSRTLNECKATKEAIFGLLDEQFFVPVLRYEDNTLQPRVGNPFSPTLSPLSVIQDRLSPRLEIQAYAGPMNKDEAERLKRKWRTPPRCLKNLSMAKMSDTEKGLECIGRNLAAEMNVPWKEYWSFLDTFADLSSMEGVQQLETFLRNRFNETLHEMSYCNETDSSIECTAWSSASPLSPMSDLCVAFNACSLNEGTMTTATRPLVVHRTTSSVGATATDLPKKTEASTDDYTVATESTPSVYLERSCQVFAKRIATAVYTVLASSTSIYRICTQSLVDGFYVEARHLRSLVLSYLQDSRFHGLDVASIHGRVMVAATANLTDGITIDEAAMLVKALPDAIHLNSELEEELESTYSCRGGTGATHSVTDNVILKNHVACMLNLLLHEMRRSKCKNEEVGGACTAPCFCDWSGGQSPKARGPAKRSFNRNIEPVTARDGPARKNLFACDKVYAEEEEDDLLVFRTPPGSPRCNGASSDTSEAESSDSETMEDPCEFPDTFIYPGDQPSKTDFAVLEAISRVSGNITPGSHPNVCRWRHLVQLAVSNRKAMRSDSHGGWHRRLPITANKQIKSEDEETPRKAVEPWERVAGVLSPRRRKRCVSDTHVSVSSPLCR